MSAPVLRNEEMKVKITARVNNIIPLQNEGEFSYDQEVVSMHWSPSKRDANSLKDKEKERLRAKYFPEGYKEPFKPVT